MDWSSIALGFGSAAIGGASTAWATVWAPRRDLRAKALASLDGLDGWLEIGEGETLDQVIEAHRAARADLIVAGVPADVVEYFNIAATAYAAWCENNPDLHRPGGTVRLSQEQELEDNVGQRLLAAGYASRAVIRWRLVHPIGGRWSTIRLRIARRLRPLPGGHVPAGAVDMPPRYGFSRLRAAHKQPIKR